MVTNNSAFINYNVFETLTDSCSTPLSLKILQQRIHELVGGCFDSPVDNFVGSKSLKPSLCTGRGKERWKRKREPVGMAKVFDFQMPVIDDMFKLAI